MYYRLESSPVFKRLKERAEELSSTWSLAILLYYRLLSFTMHLNRVNYRLPSIFTAFTIVPRVLTFTIGCYRCRFHSLYHLDCRLLSFTMHLNRVYYRLLSVVTTFTIVPRTLCLLSSTIGAGFHASQISHRRLLVKILPQHPRPPYVGVRPFHQGSTRLQ